jgi:acyl-CoA thioesterase I
MKLGAYRFALRSVVSFAGILLLGISMAAQQAIPTSGQKTVPTPGIPSTGFAGLDQYRASRIAMFTDDYGQLTRYRAANTELKGAPAQDRVVFFGDSITDTWKLENYFPGKPYVNRGISGQTTPQMLVRFRQDVIDLQPKAVVILAGTNDIAGNTGPMRTEDIEVDLASMADLAKAHGIAVILASVLPVHNYTPKSQDFFAQRPMARILEVNRWLKDYCAKNGIVYLDYFSAVVDEKGLLKKDLAADGLHPNDAGFKIMAPLAEAAIATATSAR